VVLTVAEFLITAKKTFPPNVAGKRNAFRLEHLVNVAD
jgi:hypothetical protein